MGLVLFFLASVCDTLGAPLQLYMTSILMCVTGCVVVVVRDIPCALELCMTDKYSCACVTLTVCSSSCTWCVLVVVLYPVRVLLVMCASVCPCGCVTSTVCL